MKKFVLKSEMEPESIQNNGARVNNKWFNL